LLLDQYRRDVAGDLPLRDDRVAGERLRLHLSVASVRDRLIASYPRMDVGEARPRVPSFYALELPRAIAGGLPELEAFEKKAREAAPARLNWPAPKDPAMAIDAAEYDLAVLAGGGSARHLMEVNPALARSLRGRWQRWHAKWTESDGLVTSDPGALAALAEHRLSSRPWSASSLQHFAACPYRFALHGIYQLRPRDEAVPIEQMDPLTRGGLFHAVQFALLGELKSAGLLPVNVARLDAALAHADDVLRRVAGQYEEDLAPAIPRVWQSEIEDLRTDLRGWLQHIAANDDDWEPLHFEFAFGLPLDQARDPASVADPAHLSEAGVILRGAIDLVERNTSTGALRVTDHKTGRPPDSIPLYVGGGKFLQPLLYALAAEKLLGSPVASGRLFYSTQRGAYLSALIQATPTARLIVAKLLANIDGAIAAGFLPPAPQKDACDSCDYRGVCGPYEERRFASVKDRRDERLEPLTEIRGMG
jgi:CRISPR/Cas system-associated exonuclease Cas4 (RecB family)